MKWRALFALIVSSSQSACLLATGRAAGSTGKAFQKTRALPGFGVFKKSVGRSASSFTEWSVCSFQLVGICSRGRFTPLMSRCVLLRSEVPLSRD